MANQEKHAVRLLQRALDLGKFPIGSAPMCIPVPNRPTQDSSMGAPLGSGDVPHKVATPSQVKKGSKRSAIMPEEFGASGFSDGRNAVKNEQLMTSGSLGQCDDPDCVDCPPACKNRILFQRSSVPFDDKGGRWKKKLGSVLPYIPIMNPHAKFVRHWNQMFAVSCLLAIFIDPLFFFLLSMDKVGSRNHFCSSWMARGSLHAWKQL